MNEDDIRKSLKPAYEEAQPRKAPSFDTVWANAEAEYGQSRGRYRVIGGVAAAIAVLGIAAGLWSTQQTEPGDDYLIADVLMNSTMWSAPSDSLMPEHQFDIYQDIPVLLESTGTNGGALL